jgi:hypothetical protein
VSDDARRDERDPEISTPQRSGDQFPGISGNLMATFYRDELRTTPRRPSWPLLLFPAAFVIFIAVSAYLYLSR